MKTTISLSTKRQVLNLVQNGNVFDTEVARKCGVSVSTVGRIRRGDIVVAKRINDNVRSVVKTMYDEGYSYASIIARTGVSESSIYRIGNAA